MVSGSSKNARYAGEIRSVCLLSALSKLKVFHIGSQPHKLPIKTQAAERQDRNGRPVKERRKGRSTLNIQYTGKLS